MIRTPGGDRFLGWGFTGFNQTRLYLLVDQNLDFDAPLNSPTSSLLHLFS